MLRNVILILVFLLALAPATALAGTKAPAGGKKVTRSRVVGKLNIVRVNRVVRLPRLKKGTKQQGTKKVRAGSNKQARRGKVVRTTHKRGRVVVLRTSRRNTLVALADALTGRTRHKRVVKKRVPKKRSSSSSRVRVVILRSIPQGTLSGNLRYMASKLMPGSDLRKADLQLMRLED